MMACLIGWVKKSLLMSQKITSTVIGELQQDKNFRDWWVSADLPIPFFENKKLHITFVDFSPESDPSFLPEADQALTAFLNKEEKDRLEISGLVYKNFDQIRSEVEDPYWSETLNAIKSPAEIWKFVQPLGISVCRRPYGEQDIYIDISCKCEWEEEHGLQLVFRQGKKLTRVSQIDGHLTDADAYDIPDDQDELLSHF
jgi:hypothetical protein